MNLLLLTLPFQTPLPSTPPCVWKPFGPWTRDDRVKTPCEVQMSPVFPSTSLHSWCPQARVWLSKERSQACQGGRGHLSRNHRLRCWWRSPQLMPFLLEEIRIGLYPEALNQNLNQNLEDRAMGLQYVNNLGCKRARRHALAHASKNANFSAQSIIDSLKTAGTFQEWRRHHRGRSHLQQEVAFVLESSNA